MTHLLDFLFLFFFLENNMVSWLTAWALELNSLGWNLDTILSKSATLGNYSVSMYLGNSVFLDLHFSHLPFFIRYYSSIFIFPKKIK